MEQRQIDHMMKQCKLPDTCSDPQLITTHISWVILTDKFAFKIKKPVKYSFLDFSSLEKRKYYCYEEIKLNRRLAPEMYLDVIDITSEMAGNKDENKVIEHAVKMERMDNDLAMNTLLERDKVTKAALASLAKKIADFHKNTTIINEAFDTMGLQDEFEDIKTVIDYAASELGLAYREKINRSIDESFNYLNSIRDYSNERVISGFRRDCHGDLNSKNIFLYEDPVIFDCIEFNRDYRAIDILNEIAFLCMDLDFHGKKELSQYFYQKYLKYSSLQEDSSSLRLFTYYKSYRANIRAKINLIRAKDATDEAVRIKSLQKAESYIKLMVAYL